MADTSRLITICRAARQANLKNCSGFVKAAAQGAGIYLPNSQANGLVDHLAQRWREVSEEQAVDFANKGRFVVAGAKATGHGHVVVVVPTGKVRSGGFEYTDGAGETKAAAYHGDYPRAFSTGSAIWPGVESEGEKSVFDVWSNPAHFIKVRYWLAPDKMPRNSCY